MLGVRYTYTLAHAVFKSKFCDYTIAPLLYLEHFVWILALLKIKYEQAFLQEMLLLLKYV